jgi:hypothetical protein
MPTVQSTWPKHINAISKGSSGRHSISSEFSRERTVPRLSLNSTCEATNCGGLSWHATFLRVPCNHHSKTQLNNTTPADRNVGDTVTQDSVRQECRRYDQTHRGRADRNVGDRIKNPGLGPTGMSVIHYERTDDRYARIGKRRDALLCCAGAHCHCPRLRDAFPPATKVTG